MNDELDDFIAMLDSIDIEEERRKHEEWKKQVEEDYRIINEKMKNILKKGIKYQSRKDILDESCM